MEQLPPTPATESGRYWQFLPIVVGAIIGMIPSMILTQIQGRVQRQQALFNQRLTLLTELSTTVHVDGNALLSKISDLEFELRRTPDNESASQDAELSKNLSDIQRAQLAWRAHMGVQLNVRSGLFADRLPMPDFIPKSEEFLYAPVPGLATDSIWRNDSLENVKAMRSAVISIIHEMQKLLANISSTLQN